jgi:hypothetical protein
MDEKKKITPQIVTTDQIQRVCTKIQQGNGIIQGARINRKVVNLFSSHNRSRWLRNPTEGQAIFICAQHIGRMQLLYRIGLSQNWITLDDGIPAKG